MRIISGFARGLRLKGPHGQAIRPTSDRAREALFNIIGERVREAVVLDLFAGTGAFGLEALSRGARHITFVDNSLNAINLIKKNLQLVQKTLVADQAYSYLPEGVPSHSLLQPGSIIKYDLRRESFFVSAEWKNSLPHFDLIFLDPPYTKGLSLQTLTYLDKGGLLTEQGLLIVEDHSEVELPEAFSTLTIVDRRRYGDTGFWFYKNH